jgi:methylenetetrahydrofolate dehydrogenase (NADP+) / methenyltetrahydrofolate cyclohydrolase
MTATRLEGGPTARRIRAAAGERARELAARGVPAGLAVVLVGDDPASAVYVRGKTRACEEAGVHHETLAFPASVSTAQVVEVVEGLNRRPDIHGILVQLPLPAQVDEERVLLAIDPLKDVDAFHPTNVGLLVQKRPRFVPCTPGGIMELLRDHGMPLAGRRAVVLGRSDIVGKPMALLLLHADATVTVCHSKTRDLAHVTGEADILIAAIGRPGFVEPAHVKPGAVVVDVGINRIEDPGQAREFFGKDEAALAAFGAKGYAIVGDVHPSVADRASALTPVPGGVGPLTIAQLVRNTVAAAGG